MEKKSRQLIFSGKYEPASHKILLANIVKDFHARIAAMEPEQKYPKEIVEAAAKCGIFIEQ